MSDSEFDTAIVDLDGTLIDSSYQHVLAWTQAFSQVGVPVESWRIHRHMGMGGDRLVEAVTSGAVEASLGDTLRHLWRHNYDFLFSHVRPLNGAEDLLDALVERGLSVVIASSGDPRHTRRALHLLQLEPGTSVVDADDAPASKPAPDLVRAALRKVNGLRAVMIGDTQWDIEAARACRMPTIALGTGGISSSLLGSEAAAVYDTPRDLVDDLDEALRLAAAHMTSAETGTQRGVLSESRSRR